LQDEENRFLVQRYELAYLAAGRDLVRVPAAGSSDEPPLVVADPDYGTSDNQATSNPCPFPQLPETRIEARAISKLLTDANILTGDEATKEKIKAFPAPRVLHLATHGFFGDPTVAG
jgi:CHAT domain-containing protein